jgi:hypothetical protein
VIVARTSTRLAIVATAVNGGSWVLRSWDRESPFRGSNPVCWQG